MKKFALRALVELITALFMLTVSIIKSLFQLGVLVALNVKAKQEKGRVVNVQFCDER